MANTKEIIAEETVETTPKTLDEIRRETRITVLIPYVTNSDKPELDNCIEVQVNGRIVQIKCGEPVDVDWVTFEALVNSGRYDPKTICV